MQLEDRYLWFKNTKIQLRYDDRMYCKVFYDNGNVLRSINDVTPNEPFFAPSHHVTIEGVDVKDFCVDYHNVMEIDTEFGAGRRLLLRGTAEGPRHTIIEKTLTTELYERYPSVAFTYAMYTNFNKSATLRLDRVYMNHWRLGASLADPSAEPYDFHSFQGGSIKWGRTYARIKISKDFSQENCQWLKIPARFSQGSGVPLIDLWSRTMGLAVAHVEPRSCLAMLPVKVDSDGRVDVAVEMELGLSLSPGETYRTLNTIVLVHSGDFFDALATYSSLMADQGLNMKRSPKSAYEPIWESWGYEDVWKAQNIYDVIPVLKELNLKWVTIDAPWYLTFGDWMPTPSKFAEGEKDLASLVEKLHENGFKVKLWWAPLYATLDSHVGKTSSLFVCDKDGRIPEIVDAPGADIVGSNSRYSFLCPAVPKFQEIVRNSTFQFIRDWKIDGLKLDLMHGVPLCYNIEHGHSSPRDSIDGYIEMYKIIYETSTAINPDAVVEICPCGVVGDYFSFPWQNQAVTADPVGSKQVRERIKVFKALMGPSAAVNADHVELTDIYYGPEREIDRGRDFASAVGTGGIVATKFTLHTREKEGQLVDESPHKVFLTSEKTQLWKKWIGIYNEKMLSIGEYLNLYDIAYDKPETHVIRKGDKLYYSFYSPFWEGVVHLRGLGNRRHLLYDYVNNHNIGFVNGDKPSISLRFRDHLLIEASPLET